MDEYISREAVRVAIGSKINDPKQRIELNDTIFAIPAADVAPVIHARWIETETTYEDDWGYVTESKCVCGACGYTQKKTNVCAGSGYIRKSKYCPECGAKMDLA